MLALFLLLVIIAIVLGIVGVVVKGLLYLLIIGVVVFLGAILLGALRMRRPGRRQAREPQSFTGHRGTSAGSADPAVRGGLTVVVELLAAHATTRICSLSRVAGNLFSAGIRINGTEPVPGSALLEAIGERGVDSRHHRGRLVRVGGGVDRSGVGRDARLGHVGSLLVCAARRGGSRRRVGAAGLGGSYPRSAHR